MFDNNLFFRTTGAGSLTATETATGINISGTPQRGLACVVVVPKRDVGDTVQFFLEHSTDDSTYTTLVTFEIIASITATDTTSIKLVRRFATELKYVRLRSVVAGTSPDFGAVWSAIGDQDAWNTLQVGLTTTPVGGTI